MYIRRRAVHTCGTLSVRSGQALSPTGERAFCRPGVSFSASRRTSGPVPGAAPTSHFPLLATAAPHTNGRLPSLGLRFRSRSHTPAQARKKGSSLLHSVADGRRVRLTARPDHAKKHPEFPYSEKRRIFAGDEALGKQQVREDRTAALRVDAGGGTHAAPSPRRPDGRMSQLQPYQRGQSVPQRLHLQGFGDAPCTESYIRIFLTAAVPCRAPDFMC